jgi:hypothetical protein
MNTRKIFTVALVMVSSILLYGSVVGQSLNQKTDIAEISKSGNSVSWIIKVPYESALLKVSTPSGEVFEKKFKAGSVLTFSPTNERGEFYGNGQYNYEIVLTPELSPNVKEAMAQSRVNDNSNEVATELRKRGVLPTEMVQSGTFTFNNGNLFMGDDFDKEPENFVRQSQPNAETKIPATKTPTTQNAGDIPVENAQVISQDLIVQGSECVGVDCTTSESFGFDTIRLKENNLRIRFDDTSNSASFPNNDWELTANDTTNGGANRFSITDVTNSKTPFTVEGNSPNNALYVDNATGGRVGFNTSTPVTNLHTRTGNTPTLRLEQDGSSGFTAQTWDIAGNEANFFIRDVTNGSKLPFKIIPGAPTDSLRVEANGDVTIKNNIVVQGGGGTSTTPISSAQQFYGGTSIVLPASQYVPVVDTNTFGIGSGGGVGSAALLTNIPSNLNLASQSASNVVYKIRYRDQDGTGTASRILINVVANNLLDGTRSTQVVFDSNTNGATDFNTVTVCQAVSSTFLNYATHGTHFFVIMSGTAASRADFVQIQIYKINGPC